MHATSTQSSESIDRYIADISKYPLLSRQVEVALSERYQKAGDLQAAHQLVVSNLRFVVKIAHQYRGRGLKVLDLIQEGNMGLIMAVRKFDASRGYRVITYAVWWIRAYIQNFIIRSWSLVKIGTTQGQRRLFFKLRSERERADREAGPGEVASVTELAGRLRVAETELVDMETRLAAHDFSLDVDLDNRARQTHLDMLAEPGISQEETLGVAEEHSMVRSRVHDAMKTLNDKERYIVQHRLLADDPQPLQEVGDHFHISRERARQIESRVMRKIKTGLQRINLRVAA